ncbi:Cellulose synthase-like protein D4 [Triticum urartu]|uniref:Cellulose synthase-like protein D4 n=1 Tax=Triticum urartu TaxID=4572 RepID=M8AX06_TRIUA|nr:Cellulose synthase-like protein D4 [Triticum urartu]
MDEELLVGAPVNLDCDHYVHNSAALREGMCYMLEHILADHEAAVTGRVAANAGMSQPRILQDMFDGGGRPSAVGGVAEHMGARRAVEAADICDVTIYITPIVGSLRALQNPSDFFLEGAAPIPLVSPHPFLSEGVPGDGVVGSEKEGEIPAAK